MVVSAWAMDMAVLQFLGGRLADVGDFHFEIEGLSCQWVVAVDGHHVPSDADDRDLARPVFSLCVKAHTGFDLADALKGTAWDLLYEAGIWQAVPFLR